MSSYEPVGWATDGTHPLSQANMKTLDKGIVDVDALVRTRPVLIARSEHTADTTVTTAGFSATAITHTFVSGRQYELRAYVTNWEKTVSDGDVVARWERDAAGPGGDRFGAVQGFAGSTPMPPISGSRHRVDSGSHTYRIRLEASAGEIRVRGDLTPMVLELWEIGAV